MNRKNYNQKRNPVKYAKVKGEYSTFYLIMLILATVNILMNFASSILSVWVAGWAFASSETLIGYSQIMNIILWITSVAALVLLYMRKRLGFLIKLALIPASFILVLFTTYVNFERPIYKPSLDFTKENHSYGVEIESIAERYWLSNILVGDRYSTDTNIMTTLIILFSVSTSSALLWILAWRSQTKHDAS